MVKLNIQEIANRRGITTAYQLQKRVGLFPSAAARLWNGKAVFLSLQLISDLCEQLQCAPADLLIYQADSQRKKATQ